MIIGKLLDSNIEWPAPGKYVVAVSGGADSMALLNLLAHSEAGYSLVVAHYDHAMREESVLDEALVRSAAEKYGLMYFTERSEVHIRSEAEARELRYSFLERVREITQSKAIITAHHQDDLIETSLLNLARGTGRRGLAPLTSAETMRPLLSVDRDELRKYAIENNIKWNEDISNTDESNPRNFLRHSLLPLASEVWKTEYLGIINKVEELNTQIDSRLDGLISCNDETLMIRRDTFSRLSNSEKCELISYAIRVAEPDAETTERLIVELAHFAQTGKAGRHRPVSSRLNIVIDRENIKFVAQNKVN